MQIILYRYNTYKNKVDKTLFLKLVETLEGTLKEDVSIITPTIRYEYDSFIEFNYVYIPDFKRYYFVDDVRVLSNKIYEADLSVDVLMTYKDNILELDGFVDRCSSEINPNIIDKKRVIEQGFDTEIYTVDNDITYDNGIDISSASNIIYTLSGYRFSLVRE